MKGILFCVNKISYGFMSSISFSSLLDISPMKSMFMCEDVAGESTYVESAASAVRSPAC